MGANTFSTGGRLRQGGRILALTLSMAVYLSALPGAEAQELSPDVVGHAQRELKRQQFYSGEITQNLDDSTSAAVRRYQIRQGLEVTGQLDSKTLASLAMSNGQPPKQQKEEEAAPARERARATVQDDRELLRQLESEGTLAPAPAMANTDIPEPINSRPAGEPPPEPVTSTTRRTSRSTEPAPSQPATRQRSARAEEPSTAAEPSAEPRQPQNESAIREGISKDEIAETVQSFVQAWNRSTPDRELSFYGDVVDYYGEGRTSHASITRDQRNYYRKWPERDYRLISDPQVIRLGERDATVRYRYEYDLRNGKKTARGRAEHFVRFQRDRDGDLKVVSVRERKSD